MRDKIAEIVAVYINNALNNAKGGGSEILPPEFYAKHARDAILALEHESKTICIDIDDSLRGCKNHTKCECCPCHRPMTIGDWAKC